LLLNNLNKDYKYIVTVITQSIRTSTSEINLEEIISQLLDKSRTLNATKSKNSNFSSFSSKDTSKNKSSSYSNNIEMSLQTKNNNNTKSKDYKPTIKCNYYYKRDIKSLAVLTKILT
jgi:hypothetical protein